LVLIFFSSLRLPKGPLVCSEKTVAVGRETIRATAIVLVLVLVLVLGFSWFRVSRRFMIDCG
jgi:hypothetical protein